MSLSKPLTLRHLCHLLNNILGLFYHRGENGHNLDIWVLRLRQGQMQIFLCVKVGKGLDFQKWGLNRVHETERSVFPIPRVFGMCRRRFLCKVEKGLALTTDYICLQKMKKGTLFTPPARRAWRSGKFAPFLSFFSICQCRKLGYRSWVMGKCWNKLCVTAHDEDWTTFRGTVEHTVYITKSVILLYRWSDSKRVLAFVL